MLQIIMLDGIDGTEAALYCPLLNKYSGHVTHHRSLVMIQCLNLHTLSSRIQLKIIKEKLLLIATIWPGTRPSKKISCLASNSVMTRW